MGNPLLGLEAPLLPDVEMCSVRCWEFVGSHLGIAHEKQTQMRVASPQMTNRWLICPGGATVSVGKGSNRSVPGPKMVAVFALSLEPSFC